MVFQYLKESSLVASKSFQLRNNDVKITIDRFGHLTITEDKFGRDDRFGKDDRDWNDRDGRTKEMIVMEEMIVTGNFN